jgi:two-component system phosphate regulon sensor histidine kinase PhoR
MGLAALLWMLTRWRLRPELRKLERAVQALPEFDPDSTSLPRINEFEDIVQALHGTSQRLQKRLSGAQADRLQLEALLDSMQDAVVAVDSAGRIQWTNHRMQRLIPGSSVQSPVRVGHALVQTIRDPDVLECVNTALGERVVCERRTTSMVPGRIFEVNASPMPGGGAVAVLHDITRIEQVERTQRDFVANVSHELGGGRVPVDDPEECAPDEPADRGPADHGAGGVAGVGAASGAGAGGRAGARCGGGDARTGAG